MVFAIYGGQDSEVKCSTSTTSFARYHCSRVITSDNLMQIIGQTKVQLQEVRQRNEIIKKEGEKCNNIAILLSGDVKVVAHADDHSYSIEEHIKAPASYK